MNKTIVSIALLLLSTISFAEEFTEKVTNPNEEAVAYATVVLKSIEGTFIKNNDKRFQTTSEAQKQSVLNTRHAKDIESQLGVSHFSNSKPTISLLKKRMVMYSRII